MSLQQYEQPLARVADVLRNDPPTVLLVGAGCSVSAGIPSGSGFARLIRERYTSVEADGYADCMDEIHKPQQKAIIQEKISEADVNWAHFAIAQLINDGYVNRILTTNFDPLIARASALQHKTELLDSAEQTEGLREKAEQKFNEAGRIQDEQEVSDP